MTDEERQRQMDFILKQQAQFTVNFQKLEEAQEEEHRATGERFQASERRLDRLERIVKLAVRAGLRERRSRREQDERITALVDAQISTEASMAALAASQVSTGESINRLAEIVERMATKNGNGNGTK